MQSSTFKKDKTLYIVDSLLAKSEYYEHLNYLYGISPNKKKEINTKIETQKLWMKRSTLGYRQEEALTLLDVSWSANFSQKYYSEMINRVNTFKEYHKSKSKVAVFITLTAPSEYKPLKIIKLKENVCKLVDNPNFQGVTPKDAIREFLSPQWTKFLRLKIIKKMRDNDAKFNYIKTYEPQIDGTPHVHVVAWVERRYLEEFNKVFNGHFNKSRCQLKILDNDEKAINYVMKYVVKSFDARGEMGAEGYWFAEHRIIRFTTSRALAPLSVYRKVRHDEKFRDYKKMSYLYKKGAFISYYLVDEDDSYCIPKNSEKYKQCVKDGNKLTLFQINYMYCDENDEVHESVVYLKRNYQLELYEDTEERAGKIPKKLNNQDLIIETENFKEYRRGNKTLYRFDKRNVRPKTLRELTKKELQGQLDSHYEFMRLSVNERHAIENELNFRGGMF
jgi:hypothetical protein